LTSQLIFALKKIHIVLIVFVVLLADQVLKIYVKTNFHYNESREVLGSWFKLSFIENAGMAYGLKFGGVAGKVFLTIFRIFAVIFGTWYLANIIKKGYSKWFIVCASLIYAGALGNLIDSCFYGLIFDRSIVYVPELKDYNNFYEGIAVIKSPGYAPLLKGNVVDMFYFPLFSGKFPSWFPFLGGKDFTFFSAIFNLADAAISVGVISILLFYKRMFGQQKANQEPQVIETDTSLQDEHHVS
jgi:signal peptidase II